MTNWISTIAEGWRAISPRQMGMIALLLIAWLVEWQFALRYIYLVPVWELALFDELLINSLQAPLPKSLMRMAWDYSINGHWMWLPFWFFWADFSWDQASGHLPMASSWLALLMVSLVVGSRVGKNFGERVVASLLVAIATFWPAAMESMISPLQLLTSLSLAFGAVALLLVDRQRGWIAVVAAWACAALSMASFGYGLVLWPILGLVLLRDRRWWPLLATVVIGAAAAALYADRVGSGHMRDLVTLLRDGTRIAGYLFAQAGAVTPYLLQRMDVLPAQLVGVVFIAWQAAMTVIVVRGTHWNDRQSRWLCTFAFWMLGAMLLTAVARYNLGPLQGLASRYLVPSVLYVACLVALTWRLLAPRGKGRRIVATASAIFIVGVLLGIPRYVDRYAEIRRNFTVAMLGETVGVREVDANGRQNQWLNLWPLPNVYRYLRENRMSVFSADWATWVGTDPARVFDGAPPRSCQFSVDMRTPYPEGERIVGWVYSAETGTVPRHLAFVHEDRIVGLAAVIVPRPDVAAALGSRAARNSGYYGYLPTLPGGDVRVVAHFSDGAVCAAGSFPAGADASNLPQG